MCFQLQITHQEVLKGNCSVSHLLQKRFSKFHLQSTPFNTEFKFAYPLKIDHSGNLEPIESLQYYDNLNASARTVLSHFYSSFFTQGSSCVIMCVSVSRQVFIIRFCSKIFLVLNKDSDFIGFSLGVHTV